jgi:hypothetical protein
MLAGMAAVDKRLDRGQSRTAAARSTLGAIVAQESTMMDAGYRRSWRRPVAVLLGLAALFAPMVPIATADPGVDGYRWVPGLAPEGPVVVVVSLPMQRLHVYRNGVRIGEAAVSTGKPGHETPPGVFTILQKRREHYSNLYDNAPMPFMQRLTWDGIALHEGRVPGYPASHGCIRLPRGFAEKLYSVTGHGTVVVVADAVTSPPSVTEPGFLAPVDPLSGALQDTRPDPSALDPGRAPDGPMSLVLALAAPEGAGVLVALRSGVEIGRTQVAYDGPPLAGTSVFVMLEGAGEGTSAFVPGRPARRWMVVETTGADRSALREAVRDGGLRIDPAFAAALYGALVPGTTLVVAPGPLPAGGERVQRPVELELETVP